jgi:hypothetical protein
VTDRPVARVSREELAAEGATALPDKEVLSLLDLNADIDLALDAAAPIDLAIGANANIAAPIDAAASANVLSPDQGAMLTQNITGDATATGLQDSTIDQGDATTDPAPATGDTGTVTEGTTLDGDLLNVDVNLDGDLDLAAPIDGAVAANANVAAPIDAAVAANIGSAGATSIAVADQDVIIDQTIEGDATATADQDSAIDQGSTTTP